MSARDDGDWILKLVAERTLNLWNNTVIYTLKVFSFLLQGSYFFLERSQLFLVLIVVTNVTL